MLQEDNIMVLTTNQKAHTLCKRAKLTHKQLPFVTPMGLGNHINHFLILLKATSRSICWVSMKEPLIDYLKNILMTSNHYILCAHWCKISLTIRGLKVNQITCSISLFEATTKSSTLWAMGCRFWAMVWPLIGQFLFRPHYCIQVCAPHECKRSWGPFQEFEYELT